MNPPAASDEAPARAGQWRGMIPAARWLRSYEPHWLRSDLVAGVTLAAYVLPAAPGDASLAGLPPQAGLYACLFGGLVFWLLCSSRHTCISVTSAISLLIGSSLGSMAGGDPALWRDGGWHSPADGNNRIPRVAGVRRFGGELRLVVCVKFCKKGSGVWME